MSGARERPRINSINLSCVQFHAHNLDQIVQNLALKRTVYAQVYLYGFTREKKQHELLIIVVLLVTIASVLLRD